MSSPTFRPVPASGAGTGDMTKAVYDTDDDGTVDAAESVPWSGVSNPPTLGTASELDAGTGVGDVVVVSSDGKIDPSLYDASGGGITWTEVTGTSQAAAVDNGYIANNSSLVTVTLPSTCAVGKTIRVAGKGAGLWKIAQNAGQQIIFGNKNTTSGTSGYVAAIYQYDSVELLCITADTVFTVVNAVGDLDVV